MKAPPKNHHWIETADGSHALYNEEYQEGLHSTAGAKLETLTHYLEGTKLREFAKSQPTVNILEIGLGQGLGLEETFHYLHSIECFPGLEVNYVTTEKDENLIAWVKENHPYFQKKLTSNKFQFKVTLLAGDATKTLSDFSHKNYFHCIYQDAFSPKRNPELWTREWFQMIFHLCAPGAWLSTYSASRMVIENLESAGFLTYKGEGLGKKRSSTRAQKPKE